MRAWRVQAVGRCAGCRRRPRWSARGALFLALVGSLGAVALSPAAVAMAAAPPTITIERPVAGDTEEQTPSFSGSTDDLFFDQVIVNLYAGPSALGSPLQTPTAVPEAGAWKTGPVPPLRDGQYTAVAEETNVLDETGKSNQVTFTVDTPPPQVTLSSPISGSSTSAGSQVISGTAGTATGDSPVTIQLSSGTTIGTQSPVETLVAQVSNGSWSTTVGGLGPGRYIAQAEQKDKAGNTGWSAPVTFTVTAPPAPPQPPPPAASFKWFPSAPRAGEPVSLVSTSTDATSPITNFAWSLTSTGAFLTGQPLLTTSFSTPGQHIVRLSVTDANGLSSVAAEAIEVGQPALALMLPVPIVRIAGTETSSGVDISLLAVQAPVAARVTVTCHGRGCPRRSQSLIARSSRNSKASSVQIAFRRFERSLRAGVILEIRVSKPGELGKYTRFSIRSHKLPVRVDACLESANPAPIACPS